MFKTILFDLDGTISDSGLGITLCAQHALRAFGIQADDLSQLTCFVGPPPTEMFMNKYGMSEHDAAEAMRLFRERYTEKGLYEHAIYPGIAEMLPKLKTAGKHLAVATSKPTVFSNEILEGYGILKYFDLVVGSELNGERASKAQVIEETLRRLVIGKADLADTIMVGDRHYDVLGAAACGLECVGVGYGYADPGELQEAGAAFFAPTVSVLSSMLLNN